MTYLNNTYIDTKSIMYKVRAENEETLEVDRYLYDNKKRKHTYCDSWTVDLLNFETEIYNGTLTRIGKVSKEARVKVDAKWKPFLFTSRGL